MPKYQKNAQTEQSEREIIFKQANEAYTAIKNDPKQWQEEQEELALWESTLEDGLSNL